MSTEQKSFAVSDLKTSGSKGEFRALVSVFGNVDSDGDRTVKGAFERGLGENGFPPIVWSHQWKTVPIGVPLDVAEATGVSTPSGVKDGLLVDGKLFVDDNATAREVYAAMKTKGGDGRPALRQFSFAYEVVNAKTARDADFKSLTPSHRRDLLDLDVIEVGPCLRGANTETDLITAKAAAAKLSPDAVLRAAVELLELDVDAEAVGKAAADVDAYPVWLLLSMIDSGTSYVAYEQDANDVAAMKRLVRGLLRLLNSDFPAAAGDSEDSTAKSAPERDVFDLLAARPRVFSR